MLTHVSGPISATCFTNAHSVSGSASSVLFFVAVLIEGCTKREIEVSVYRARIHQRTTLILILRQICLLSLYSDKSINPIHGFKDTGPALDSPLKSVERTQAPGRIQVSFLTPNPKNSFHELGFGIFHGSGEIAVSASEWSIVFEYVRQITHH
jgi:hypothetical protein